MTPIFRSSHQKRTHLFGAHTEWPPFSTKFYTECPLLPFSGRHLYVTWHIRVLGGGSTWKVPVGISKRAPYLIRPYIHTYFFFLSGRKNDHKNTRISKKSICRENVGKIFSIIFKNTSAFSQTVLDSGQIRLALRRGDRGRLQHFFPYSSYYLYYSRKATKVDFFWRGHLSAWFSSGFELPHYTCSFRAVNVLKQGVKCCNMPHITWSVASLPGDNCNTMSQNIHWEQWGQLRHFCLINYIVTLLFIKGNQS